MYIKRPESSNVKWDAYLVPLSTNTWKVIALFFVIMSGSIVLIQKLFTFAFPYLPNEDHSSARFTEILFYVIGAFCGQGNSDSLATFFSYMTITLTTIYRRNVNRSETVFVGSNKNSTFSDSFNCRRNLSRIFRFLDQFSRRKDTHYAFHDYGRSPERWNLSFQCN